MDGFVVVAVLISVLTNAVVFGRVESIMFMFYCCQESNSDK